MDIARNFQALLYYPKLMRRNRRFNKFLKTYVPMTEDVYYSNSQLEKADLDFDYYICGSDQIWNTYCLNYDSAFILKFAKNKGKRISYAASLGAANINETNQEEFARELSDFKALSVREINATSVISELSGKDTQHVIDPVFLLDCEDWNSIADEKLLNKPYIFFYFVHGDLPGMRDYVMRLSNETGLPIVAVNMSLREWKYKNIKMYDAGPKEFVSLIKNAEYVCPNSFHASAFSVIFKKKFIVFTDKGKSEGVTSSRIYSILESLSLENRAENGSGDLNQIKEDIDFNLIYDKLIPLIEKSKKFLDDAIND